MLSIILFFITFFYSDIDAAADDDVKKLQQTEVVFCGDDIKPNELCNAQTWVLEDLFDHMVNGKYQVDPYHSEYFSLDDVFDELNNRFQDKVEWLGGFDSGVSPSFIYNVFATANFKYIVRMLHGIKFINIERDIRYDAKKMPKILHYIAHYTALLKNEEHQQRMLCFAKKLINTGANLNEEVANHKILPFDHLINCVIRLKAQKTDAIDALLHSYIPEAITLEQKSARRIALSSLSEDHNVRDGAFHEYQAATREQKAEILRQFTFISKGNHFFYYFNNHVPMPQLLAMSILRDSLDAKQVLQELEYLVSPFYARNADFNKELKSYVLAKLAQRDGNWRAHMRLLVKYDADPHMKKENFDSAYTICAQQAHSVLKFHMHTTEASDACSKLAIVTPDWPWANFIKLRNELGASGINDEMLKEMQGIKERLDTIIKKGML